MVTALTQEVLQGLNEMNKNSLAKHLAHSKSLVTRVAITLHDSEPHFPPPSFIIVFPLLPVTTLKRTDTETTH